MKKISAYLAALFVLIILIAIVNFFQRHSTIALTILAFVAIVAVAILIVRVAAQSKKMLDRFEAAIKRLENLSARIATRLEVISKTDKKDVAKETEALTVVKEGITASRTKLAEARTAFEAVVGSETPQTALDEAKAKLGELKEMIASSHQGLVAVVNSIKGESGAKKPAADSEATEK